MRMKDIHHSDGHVFSGRLESVSSVSFWACYKRNEHHNSSLFPHFYEYVACTGLELQGLFRTEIRMKSIVYSPNVTRVGQSG